MVTDFILLVDFWWSEAVVKQDGLRHGSLLPTTAVFDGVATEVCHIVLQWLMKLALTVRDTMKNAAPELHFLIIIRREWILSQKYYSGYTVFYNVLKK